MKMLEAGIPPALRTRTLEPGQPPPAWPVANPLHLHPRKPDRARKISERLSGRVAMRVVFLLTAGTDATWRTSDLWSRARDLPGATVVADVGEAEAGHFGGFTSGQVLLCSSAGTLLFSHGFTTKSGGHGFGLHSSANAAKEMEGALTCHSAGSSIGATFRHELPMG